MKIISNPKNRAVNTSGYNLQKGGIASPRRELTAPHLSVLWAARFIQSNQVALLLGRTWGDGLK